MFDGTVTLFNGRRAGDGSVTWYPTVLEGAELQTDRAAIAAKYGAESADKAILYMPYVWNAGPTVGGKPYLTPRLWRAAEDPAGAVTFQTGAEFDFFIEGTWEDTAPIDDGVYTAGLYDHMNRTMDGVYAIDAVSRYDLIPHFEVTGK